MGGVGRKAGDVGPEIGAAGVGVEVVPVGLRGGVQRDDTVGDVGIGDVESVAAGQDVPPADTKRIVLIGEQRTRREEQDDKRALTAADLARLIRERTGNVPWLPLPIPRRLSKRPIFFG